MTALDSECVAVGFCSNGASRIATVRILKCFLIGLAALLGGCSSEVAEQMADVSPSAGNAKDAKKDASSPESVGEFWLGEGSEIVI